MSLFASSTERLIEVEWDKKFQVVEVHHFGNFRQADPDSWVTTFNAVATSQAIPQYIAGPNVATLQGVA